MSGFAKTFQNGFFHNLSDYQAIAFVEAGPLTINHEKAVYIDYSDPSEIKFVDNGEVVYKSSIKDVAKLMKHMDRFCDYLGCNVLEAYSELRGLVNNHILKGSVDIVGQLNWLFLK